MHNGDDEGPWLPFGQGEDVWRPESAEGAERPSRPEQVRRWGMVGGIVFVGLAIAVGGGAFGADAYATHAICAAVGRTGPVRNPDGAAKNSAVALDKARRTLDDTAALLFFHPALRSATRGLAHDLADMRALQDAGDPTAAPSADTGRMLVVAMSVDGHARQAQTACGLPAEGILNAAAPRPVTVPGLPDAAPGFPPTVPEPTRTAPAAPVTALPPRPRATPSPTAPDSTTPGYTATAGELWTAEQMVAVTAGKDRAATSAVERQVTSYEHAAAVQHLADLKAGTPHARHHALDVRGAKARLAAAEEAYRRAAADPAATDLDRRQARAIVEQWDETLTRLEN